MKFYNSMKFNPSSSMETQVLLVEGWLYRLSFLLSLSLLCLLLANLT